MAALRQLGAAAAIERDAAPIAAFGAADQHGRWIMGPLLPGRRSGAGAYLPTRALLQQSLLALLPEHLVQLGSVLVDLTSAGQRVDATSSSGRQLSIDLVVDATGVWSDFASREMGGLPYRADYSGVLALTRPHGQPISVGTEFWGADERFGVFDAGQGRSYWFYMAGPFVQAGLSLGELSRRADSWPASVQRAVRTTDEDALVPVQIHARAPARRLGRGRIVCVGDAAHAMEPNLGQGGCQGIEDAAVLSRLASACQPDQLVKAFERERLARVRQIQLLAARAGSTVHAGPVTRRIGRALLGAVPTAIHQIAVDRLQRFQN